MGAEIADTALNPLGQGGRAAARRGRVEGVPDRRGGQPRPGQGFHDIQPLLAQVIERIDLLYSRENPCDVTGVPTGYSELDQMTSGSAAGRSHHRRRAPEHGQDRVRAQHRRARRRGRERCRWRCSAWRCRARSSRCACSDRSRASTSTSCAPAGSPTRTGTASPTAVGKLHEAPIHIDETGSLNPLELRARARRLAAPVRQAGADRHRLPAADVVTDGKREENRATEISEISRSLKALAKELSVPGGRAVAAQPQRRPAARQAAGHVGPARVRRASSRTPT